jgi:hypothetical protein
MPLAGFKPIIPDSERAKNALDRVATIIGPYFHFLRFFYDATSILGYILSNNSINGE